MIVTVTPNPSIDRTLWLTGLTRGGLNRADRVTSDPGGKGVNVSMALASNGLQTKAVVVAGGDEGTRLARRLALPGLDLVAVPIAAATRSNITLVEPAGVITKINEPGPTVTKQESKRLFDEIRQAVGGARWLVGCGSLPQGIQNDFYAALIEELSLPVAVDTTGASLLKAADAGAALIKPNRHELAETLEHTPHTLGDIVEMAQELRRRGAGEVLVTLGSDGAVLVGCDVLHGEAPVARLTSAVGAGDALLAGYLATESGGREALLAGLRWAAACCELPNTQMPTPAAIARQSAMLHRRVDMRRPLHATSEAG